MDWQAFLQDPDIYDTMGIIAYKRFYDEVLSEEAFVYCIDKLKANNFSRLNKYTGANGASQKTFFCRVYRNLVEDFAKSKFGACTPPTWIERLGTFWKKLFKQLCCHALDKEKIISNPDVFYVNESASDKDEMIFPEDLALAIETIKQKDPKCTSRGKKTEATSLDNEDNTHIHSELATDSLESDISRSDFELVLQVLNLWLKQDESIQSSSNSFLVDLQQLTFAKTTEEHNRIIVLLRLHFQEQMKLPAAAKLIGMEVHTARRRKDDALKSIQSVFINNNITGFSL